MSEGRGYAREDLQALAEQRLADARLLLENERFSSAHYLAGYAVELALKACLAKAFRADTLPEPGFVRKIYIHDLDDLVALAELAAPLKRAAESDPKLAAHWSVVAEWQVSSRYVMQVSSRYVMMEPDRCVELIEAIDGPDHGVFAWLKTRW